MLTATLPPPAARPAVPPGQRRVPVDRFVFDTKAAYDAGGPLPPCVQLDAVAADGVRLNVQPTPGMPFFLWVPSDEAVPVPECPGWTAHCHRPDPAARDSYAWLEHDGTRPPPKPRDPTCPF